MAKKKEKIEEEVIEEREDELVIENRTIYPTGFRNIDTNIANRVFDEVTDEIKQTNRGVLSGSMITFIGNSHTGKSTLLFQILGNMIRPFVKAGDRRVKVHIFDVENGVNMNRLKFLTNFRDAEMATHFIQEVDLAIEDLKNLVTKIIETKKKEAPDKMIGSQGHSTDIYYPTFIVIDAMSEMIPEASLDITKDDTNTMYMRQSLELDKFFKRYKSYFVKYNINLLVVAHISRKIEIGAMPGQSPAREWRGLPANMKINGGKILQYNTDIGIYLAKIEAVDTKSVEKKGGTYLNADSIIEARLFKNRQGMDNTTFYLVQDAEVAFNPLKSFLYECAQLKILEAAGSVRKLEGYGTVRSQDIINKFLNEPEFRKTLYLNYDKYKENILNSSKRTAEERNKVDALIDLMYEEV